MTSMGFFVRAAPPCEFLLACGGSLILFAVKLSRSAVSGSRNKRHNTKKEAGKTAILKGGGGNGGSAPPSD